MEQRLGVDGDPAQRTVGTMYAHDHVAAWLAGSERDHGGMVFTGEGRSVFADRLPARIHGGSAHDLILGEAQDARGTGIGRADNAVAILQDHTVGHGRDKRAVPLLAVPQFTLYPLLLADILEGAEIDVFRSVRPALYLGNLVKMAHFAIGPDDAVFEI